jgi:uncharacterized protein HemX
MQELAAIGVLILLAIGLSWGGSQFGTVAQDHVRQQQEAQWAEEKELMLQEIDANREKINE